MAHKDLTIIGTNTLINIDGVVNEVPAKIDTGADSSALWASNVHIDPNGILHYTLFDKKSPLYTGEEFTTEEFTVAGVVSSSGHREIRYRVTLPTIIEGRRIKVNFNLSKRSKHRFPVLIGKRTLKNRFLVDVSLSPIVIRPTKTPKLNNELKKDPHEFYQKYHQLTVNEVKE